VWKGDAAAGAPLQDDLGGAGVLSLRENGPEPNEKNTGDNQPGQPLPKFQVPRNFR